MVKQILPHQGLHKLVPVDFTDHAPGVAKVCDVGGVLGQQVAHDLIDGVIPLLGQGVEHTAQDQPHVLLVIGYVEGQSILIRHGLQLLFKRMFIL